MTEVNDMADKPTHIERMLDRLIARRRRLKAERARGGAAAPTPGAFAQIRARRPAMRAPEPA